MAVKDDDFLLKEIEKFGDLVRGFFGIALEKDYEQEAAGLSKVLREKEKINLHYYRDLSEEKLLREISSDAAFLPVKMKLIAEYMLQLAKDYPQYADSYKGKALILLFHMYKTSRGIISMDLLFKIERTVDDLEGALLTPPVFLIIFDFYFSNHKWAKAENVLFSMVENDSFDKEKVKELGRSFYEKLLKLGEEELKEGDFSQVEVVQGLKDLEDA